MLIDLVTSRLPTVICRCCIALFTLALGTPPAFAQIYLGNYTGHFISGNTVTVHADTASVRFVFYRPDIVRVDFLPSPSTIFDSSLVVIRDSASDVIPLVLQDDSSSLVVSSFNIIVSCDKAPLRFRFSDEQHRVLFAEGDRGGFSSNFSERNVEFAIAPDEHYYGTGERGTAIDRRGQAFSSYNTQNFGYASPLPTMNINIPFVASSKGYGLYFENSYPARFDFGRYDPALFSYSVTGGELRYYFFAAPTIEGQLEGYTWLTGLQPLPPRWAFGFIQSKFGYANDAEARSMVQTMRQKQIPCDAIVLDLYWFNQMGDISWKSSAWPDPFGMMRDFLAAGFKTIVITEPYITEYSTNFLEAVAAGVLAKNAQGNPYLLSNWWSCNCNAALVDFTSSTARAWWWNKHPSFFGAELAGIWTDLGEPERHPSDMTHAMGEAAKVHNIYNLLWAKTIFEGYAQFRPGQRLFNLTRSGYAGIQRYGVIPWSGDVGRNFGGLAVQPPMMLSMGLSGLGYHNSDIGGFVGGGGSAELYVRWMQYGAFSPIMRAHGTGAPTEPWGYGPDAEAIARKYIQLRYQLLPYIYTLARENSWTGKPLARPLFFEQSGDHSLASESSTYLWGDAFVVSPVVVGGATTKNVTLPPGKWVNYWTDQEVEGGGTLSVAAPLETLPLFVRAGSIVPMQPVMQYSDERPLDTLMLAVYPFGGAGGTYELYEDDGKTLDHENGSFSHTPFRQRTNSTGGGKQFELSIGASTGSYAGQPQHRAYLADVHGVVMKPATVLVNTIPIPERATYDGLRQGGAGFYFDAAGSRLHMQIPTVPDSAYDVVAERIELTGIGETQGGPQQFILFQNYPNPFNPKTGVRFQVSGVSDVKLTVYDLLGREVAVLVDERKAPGSYEVSFDGTGLASGVYFCRMTAHPTDGGQAGSFVAFQRMVLLK